MAREELTRARSSAHDVLGNDRERWRRDVGRDVGRAYGRERM